MVVTVVWGAVVVVVEVPLAGVAGEVRLAKIAVEVTPAEFVVQIMLAGAAGEGAPAEVAVELEPDGAVVLVVVGVVLTDVPNARKFLITTSSAEAAGSNTSAPPEVM
jgi:hypothetical protein